MIKTVTPIDNSILVERNFASNSEVENVLESSLIARKDWSNTSLANEVNIYSHRHPFLINPFLEEFTKKTGIKTNVVYSTKGLAQRLKSMPW